LHREYRDTYTFDAEGNITAVDGGQTAQYVYNALNQRVRATVGSAPTEYVFNANGQRVSEWNGTLQLQGKYYWGGKPVAYHAGGAAHFEHQDWLGTERMRTAYNGGVEGSYISLPYGDGQATTGADGDANHYGMLDADPESWTDHAQFRQYSEAEGRWLAPDPYSGSYTLRNPQSFNRYVYAGNNPLTAVDPSGLDDTQTMCMPNGDGTWDCSGRGFTFTLYDVTIKDGAISGTAWGVTQTYPQWGGVDGDYDNNLDTTRNDPRAFFGNSGSNGQPTDNAGGAPNNGPSYSHADVCAASTLLNKGGATFLDALGIIPGEGNLLAGVQAGAGLISAGMAVFGNDTTPADFALSSAGLGLTWVNTLKTIGGSAGKAVPIAGNILSGYSTYRDINPDNS
jgi:RHS repeat-associated protein